MVGCNKSKADEGIVARVNGEVITEEEFDREFNEVKKVYEGQLGEDSLSQDAGNESTLEDLLRESVLNELVLEKLVFQDAEEIGITVSNEELEAQLEEDIVALGGEEEYKSFLESNNFTEEEYKADLEKRILYDKHAEIFKSEIQLSKEDIEKYFEENKEKLTKFRVSHILVESEEEGLKILEKLEAGEDFESLAITESKDTISASRGGDLGYVSKETSTLGEEINEVIFDMEEGEISQPIGTELGYHVVLVEERLDSYEELKDDISDTLENEKYIEKVSNLMEEAEIEILMEKSKDEKDKQD